VLQTGDILVGRYEVDSLLGRGGMGSVYSAFDRTLGRDVAIKVLAAELVEDELFIERFDREARAAASLSHRNVVAVFDSGVDGGVRFIVMERVSGRTLSALLREGPLPVARAVEIALSVAHALGAAHAHGIVHRDVKPGNVMVGDGGEVKVLDFGIARALDATSLTRATTVIGTAGYLSPEQANGGPVDARSDLYGLGCVIYEMLTGRPPFVADSAAALVNQHATRPPGRPSRRRPEGSAALDEVVLRCLAKDPGERYDPAQALCAALMEVPPTRNGSAADGDGPTRVPSGVRWRRSAPRPVGSAKPRAAHAGRWTATPGPARAHRQRKRRWLAAPAAAAVLAALALLLYQGSDGRPGAARTQGSAAPSKHNPASDPKRAATSDRRSAARTIGAPAAAAGAPAGSTAVGSSDPPATSGAADPAAAAAALNGLVLADQRQGLIDERAASVISRRTAGLLDAGSARDPNQAAHQLSDFGRRLDALAVRGDISSSATTTALKGAAAELANALMSSSGSNAEPSPAGGVPATHGEGPAPAASDKGRGHRQHGPAAGSQD
jgi:eukaryotic-like serine/threonine-protein kinase